MAKYLVSGYRELIVAARATVEIEAVSSDEARELFVVLDQGDTLEWSDRNVIDDNGLTVDVEPVAEGAPC